MGHCRTSEPALQVQLLREFDIRVGGRSIAPSGNRRRTLLALLAIDVGHVVPVDRLIDGVWGQDPPASAVNLVQTYVSLWRRLLDEHIGVGSGRRCLKTTGSGYQLSLAPEELDLSRCRALVGLGRVAAAEGRTFDAAEAYARAADCWGDAPLADLSGEGLQAALNALDQERRTVLREWGRAALSAGWGTTIVSAMQAALARDPLQEGLAALLMRALSADGRDAEALSVFKRTRADLAEQLGSSPCPELERVHLQILRREGRSVPAASAPPTRDSAAHLPIWTDTLFGREAETKDVHDLVRRHRMLTLTGPGGAGKTRLACEVAASVADSGVTRVVFLDASVLSGPEQLMSRTAVALGVQVVGEQSPLDAIRATAGREDVLLLADNLEHLPDAGHWADSLLSAVPALCLMATSRTPLGAPAEQRYRVGPLDASMQDMGGGRVQAGPAVALFIARASAVEPLTWLAPDDLATIAAICRRLDGLPLAIELAAGWRSTLPLPALARQLDKALDLLVSPARHGRPDRHATLRATIEWSYDLLEPRVRGIVRMLSVFSGGFTVEAASHVCQVPPASLLPDLRHLVDHGMLVARTGSHEEARFTLLLTVSEFAAELLAERSGEQLAGRDRHATYYLDLATSCAGGLGRADQAQRLDALFAERDNVYAAIAVRAGGSDPEPAVRTAASLWRFWHLRSLLDEGRSIVTRLLRLDENAVSTATRGRLVLAVAGIRYWQLAHEDALALYDRAIALLDLGNDRCGQADATYGSGYALVLLNRPAEGRQRLLAAMDAYRDLGDARGCANAMAGLAVSALLAGDPEHAVTRSRQALAELQCLGDLFEIANVTALFGAAQRAAGLDEAAERVLQDAMAAHHGLGNVSGMAWVAAELAWTALRRGDHGRAGTLGGAADGLTNDRHPMIPLEVLALDALRGALPSSASPEDTWNRGRVLSLDELLATALEGRAGARSGIRTRMPLGRGV